MVSAFRTGEIAGSVVARALPDLTGDQQKQAAATALEERKQAGIAHCYPEEEFVKGFLAGYGNPQPGTDGLHLALEEAKMKHLN